MIQHSLSNDQIRDVSRINHEQIRNALQLASELIDTAGSQGELTIPVSDLSAMHNAMTAMYRAIRAHSAALLPVAYNDPRIANR
jgi:hypothetical protein